ncbi:methyltransferase domain-containing protein [Pseudidiomarina sp. 1APR75-15]|uniref:Methyltransferase domain-containing protein n=1 Tax=Pseudidiomarina terrestris TaxID=2820060 RepID=A0ABT8MI92_9GAMM|nr:class I SAM-dependent methyltransferase [Pseudidiomarina sp. 1APR75-15]MDN7129659.1 methyltransferase domain-containing protein [Pseudidiomarina sp. 1APR75-15]
MKKSIKYPNQNADSLVDHIDFEAAQRDWLTEIPSEGMVLDIGASSGRDARYLANKGLSVVAVESDAGIREQAQQYDAAQPIHWIDDSLPELSHVHKLQTKFDLVLLGAAWMDVPSSARQRSFRKLSSLLKPNGKMVVSLSHGESPDDHADELAQFAQQQGLTYKVVARRDDASLRQTILLTLPDDGTGAFPLIRNIVINDSKASTYKVALLRTLLRIAEGHPGAVLEQTDTTVALPMGLVALYWLKLYKPLLDQYEIQQSSSSKGLGFVKADGWQTLKSFTANDFYIGACYFDTGTSNNLYRTLKDIAATIKNMPAKYITLPGTKTEVFQVELQRTRKPGGALVLDYDFLKSLGTFYVPRSIWDALSRFSVWIEPALVNEWSNLMASYTFNLQRSFSQVDYLNALRWENPERTTHRVRKRVEALLAEDQVHCCWSGSAIRHRTYAVDHAFPFARWPNNDLWNLLPTKTAINAQKSDKLPTNHKLLQSREFIVHWWQQGWEDYNSEFFTQANFALPNLSPRNESYSDVFEALALQRDRIKHLQQLEDW